MPTYRYGSRPTGKNTFRDFVRFLAPRLPSEDDVFKCNGSVGWRDNVALVTKDFFRSLCHWKSPRNMRHVNDNTLPLIRSALENSLEVLREHQDESDIRKAIKALCLLRGVGVKTASALLTAWNPDCFGIYDFKTHELLGLRGRSDSATPDTYLTFLRELRELAQELSLTCSLRQIELAVWHYYPVQKTGSGDCNSVAT